MRSVFQQSCMSMYGQKFHHPEGVFCFLTRCHYKNSNNIERIAMQLEYPTLEQNFNIHWMDTYGYCKYL